MSEEEHLMELRAIAAELAAEGGHAFMAGQLRLATDRLERAIKRLRVLELKQADPSGRWAG